MTTMDGMLRQRLIEGVRFRPARPVSHHRGHLTEVLRLDWKLTDTPLPKLI
jgi:hypothetical protein